MGPSPPQGHLHSLMMVRKSNAALEEAIGVVPLVGNAKYLADELLA